MNEVTTAKSCETGALDTWYRVHAQKLFCTARRITRNHEDAEDAVQDAFLSAFLHLQSFEGRSTFSTWLTRIGINSALMTLRRKGKYREVSVEGGSENSMVPEEADFAPNPEQHYAQQERGRLVRKAIADLRLSIRRPVELHALQGYSMKEMAGEIGVSVAAAKGRLYHAKRALQIENPSEHKGSRSADGDWDPHPMFRKMSSAEWREALSNPCRLHLKQFAAYAAIHRAKTEPEEYERNI
jgi:RNA polymerase sigma-70 factor (ECF subfamily)